MAIGSLAGLAAEALAKGARLSELAAIEEAAESGSDIEAVRAKMLGMLRAMRDSVRAGAALEGRSVSGLTGGEAKLYGAYADRGASLLGPSAAKAVRLRAGGVVRERFDGRHRGRADGGLLRDIARDDTGRAGRTRVLRRRRRIRAALRGLRGPGDRRARHALRRGRRLPGRVRQRLRDGCGRRLRAYGREPGHVPATPPRWRSRTLWASCATPWQGSWKCRA